MNRAAVACLILLGLVGHGRAAPSRAKPISIKKGLPKATGLGRMVVVTNLPGRDARYRAIKTFAAWRDAKIVRFKENNVAAVRKALRRDGPEFVAFAVTPETVDINFHYDVLEMCRDLDSDPMPDFHFGYLCARDGPDMEAWVRRMQARESKPPAKPTAKIVALTGSGAQLYGLDYILHFGHGQAWCVTKGMTGKQVGALELERAPVVWSGACFNGVLSRSYHRSQGQYIFMPPATVPPEQLMTLNWVHAGVSGYFAALEGDRGEMAVAEWETFRRRACSLGETIGEQYRLAFTSLPADYPGFPRYVTNRKKRMLFYDVMLRGMVSRLLLSDPSLRPLREPMDKPVHQTTVEWNKKKDALVVKVEVLRAAQGAHLNYLPKSRRGVFDHRVYVRVALDVNSPADLKFVDVAVAGGKKAPVLTRTHVRHEVWGGVRYLNLQAEGPPATTRKGNVFTWQFRR